MVSGLIFRWLSLGNLRNWGNYGLWYVNGNNGCGDARWNIGSRLSGKSFGTSAKQLHEHAPKLVFGALSLT